ncbi:hypothetical protein U8607_07895 [Methylobacterium durans]|uniref:hypothetical protein n=1 Tax=Methylobacterium durans TaxID=2202825 RepID=UPI002AFF8E7A|nr:hypothetical protein [Methylobacterium durans]MEA1832004.1 hypothetical protein [Methylobacterium durans]
MTFWLAIRRLLPLLAVLSLALTPVTASAAAAGIHATPTLQTHASHEAMPDADHSGMTSMDMDAMPCCPPEKVAKPDCTKAGCPLMALCLASVASLPPAAVSVPAPAAVRAAPSWPDAPSFVTLHGPPLPEPPRA